MKKLLHHFPRTYADLQNAQVDIEDGQYLIFVGKVLSSKWVSLSDIFLKFISNIIKEKSLSRNRLYCLCFSVENLSIQQPLLMPFVLSRIYTFLKFKFELCAIQYAGELELALHFHFSRLLSAVKSQAETELRRIWVIMLKIKQENQYFCIWRSFLGGLASPGNPFLILFKRNIKSGTLYALVGR